MTTTFSVEQILEKYPGKLPLWNFTKKSFVIPNKNSRATTVQFLLDMLDTQNKNIYK
jgi:hypothetical protein